LIARLFCTLLRIGTPEAVGASVAASFGNNSHLRAKLAGEPDPRTSCTAGSGAWRGHWLKLGEVEISIAPAVSRKTAAPEAPTAPGGCAG
jgi:hypothetical protein